MCQQTQVATVIRYWERWLSRLPTVDDLAAASEQEVLSLWAGLGYYRRARNLQLGAKWIVVNGFPKSYEEWLQVPGVGEYTAGAIASICLSEPVPAVDGNVHRVFARLNASKLDRGQLERKAREWALDQVHHSTPGDWNQALMELGAAICRPREAKCEECPVSAYCLGRTSPLDFPVPKPKKESIQVVRYAALCERKGSYAIRQTAPGEWGEGLWEFPTREEPWEGEVIGELKHVVTHHRVQLRVQEVLDGDFDDWRTPNEINALPLSSAQRRVLRQFATGCV